MDRSSDYLDIGCKRNHCADYPDPLWQEIRGFQRTVLSRSWWDPSTAVRRKDNHSTDV